jgi:hypothetical protein
MARLAAAPQPNVGVRTAIDGRVAVGVCDNACDSARVPLEW